MNHYVLHSFVTVNAARAHLTACYPVNAKCNSWQCEHGLYGFHCKFAYIATSYIPAICMANCSKVVINHLDTNYVLASACTLSVLGQDFNYQLKFMTKLCSSTNKL